MKNFEFSHYYDKNFKHRILSPWDLAKFVQNIWRQDFEINVFQARDILRIISKETVLHKKFCPGNICNSSLDWFIENAIFTIEIIKDKVFKNNVTYPLGLEIAKIFREAYRHGVDLIYSIYLQGLWYNNLLNHSVLKSGLDNIKEKAYEMINYADSLEYFLKNRDDRDASWDPCEKELAVLRKYYPELFTNQKV